MLITQFKKVSDMTGRGYEMLVDSDNNVTTVYYNGNIISVRVKR